MKLNIEVDGTPTELAEFLRLMGKGEIAEYVLEEAFKRKSIGLKIDTGYARAFAEVGWGTLLLCVIIADEFSSENGVYSVPYAELYAWGDLLGDSEKVAARKISSRIGGLRKVTDRLELPPALLVERIDDERHVVMIEAIKDEAREYVQVYQQQWYEWLEENNIDPDELVAI